MQPSGLADGMIKSDDVRRLECFIEMTRNLPASSGPIINLSGLSEECTQQKKPRAMPGLRLGWRFRKSIYRPDRAGAPAEAVVHAHGDHIHVLADAVGCEE